MKMGKKRDRILKSICELAALYAVTLGDVDTAASRSAIAAAKGLSDEELGMELAQCLVTVDEAGGGGVDEGRRARRVGGVC
jgi:hypothetical protein